MARLINASAVTAIMKQRIAITETDVNTAKIVFTIAGNGTQLPMTDKLGVPVVDDDGVILNKKIFNLRANSALAMSLPINRELLKSALVAERAGQAEDAHKLFNDYLNKVQMSFNIVLPSKTADKLYDGVEISARVEKITTDNGSLLTIDPKTISIVAPEFRNKTTFSLDEYMKELEPAADGSEVPAKTELTA